MNQFCRFLAWTILIFGITGSFILAKDFGTSLEGFYYPTLERDWAKTSAIFISGAFGSFVFFAILETLAEILEKLDTVQYKTTAVEQTVDAELGKISKQIDALKTPVSNLSSNNSQKSSS